MKKLFLAAILGSILSLTNASVLTPVNEEALFLAGKPNSLTEKSKTIPWQAYSKKMTRAWQNYDKTQFKSISAWSTQNITLKPQNVFYPFGGPDITHALMFFPTAKSFTLIGLEPVGKIPNSQAESDNVTAKGLERLGVSVSDVLGRNFFMTNHMKEQVKNDDYNGVASMLLFFLSSAGAKIESVEMLEMQDNKLVVGATGTQGVRIKFTYNGQEKEVNYLSWDLSNSGLTNKQMRKSWLEAQKYDVTMLKAASYLNWLPNFSIIKSDILNNSSAVMTDSSGMKYTDFGKEWSVNVYGQYSRPIDLFKTRIDKELQAAPKKSDLPFSYGYNRKSHIMLAVKK